MRTTADSMPEPSSPRSRPPGPPRPLPPCPPRPPPGPPRPRPRPPPPPPPPPPPKPKPPPPPPKPPPAPPPPPPCPRSPPPAGEGVGAAAPASGAGMVAAALAGVCEAGAPPCCSVVLVVSSAIWFLQKRRPVGGGETVTCENRVLPRQNCRPPARAASARALMRPWYLRPPRSNATLVTPIDLARSAIARPTRLAASMLPPFFSPSPRTSASVVAAAARVRPA